MIRNAKNGKIISPSTRSLNCLVQVLLTNEKAIKTSLCLFGKTFSEQNFRTLISFTSTKVEIPTDPSKVKPLLVGFLNALYKEAALKNLKNLSTASAPTKASVFPTTSCCNNGRM
jgi:hypothetical protein